MMTQSQTEKASAADVFKSNPKSDVFDKTEALNAENPAQTASNVAPVPFPTQGHNL